MTRTDYSHLRSQGKLHGTIRRAKSLAKSRAAAAAEPERPTLLQRLAHARSPVPLGVAHTMAAQSDAIDLHPRRSNWETPLAVRQPLGPDVKVRTISHGRYSRGCKWNRVSYSVSVESRGFLTPAGLRYVYRGRAYWFPHPRGYRWSRDDYGIRLVQISSQDDYHPTSDDLIDEEGRRRPLRHITQLLRDGARVRREERRKQAAFEREQRAAAAERLRAIRQAEREGCRVRLADSTTAGNCAVGSAGWCRAHNLDPAGHVAPTALAALATGFDGRRVRLVLAAALRRHATDMRRGYCTLG